MLFAIRSRWARSLLATTATVVAVCFLAVTSCKTKEAEEKTFSLASANKKVQLQIHVGKQLRWSASFNGEPFIDKGDINLKLQSGETLGEEPAVISAKEESINNIIATPFYKKDSVVDAYNQLTISFKGDYGIICRVYDDAIAYRFYTSRKDCLVIASETADFNFAKDFQTYIPIVHSSLTDKYEHAYESVYRHIPLSAAPTDSLAYLPMLIELDNGAKAFITEADVEDYPAMYLKKKNGSSYVAEAPTYALSEEQGGYNQTQSIVIKRADYVARTAGNRKFPWRVISFSNQDKELLNSDVVYKLAAPNRLQDISWIKPGKVAWDWWNDWNISHVNFEAGINTATYKAYIDFAAANKLEYILLDEGWAEKGNIMKVVPAINLQEIIDYGRQKDVDVWLWGGKYPIDVVMDQAFANYSKMGVKGFKIDFINRDDQGAINFYYLAAKKAADYKLMLDFHGACKPTGLMRTYPNVLNYEAVFGLEQVKFPNDVSFPDHDLLLPFIRMTAGAMDYTPGAMRNATKKDFHISMSNPVSQGTRCHQLALYIVYEAPLNMLCDNPTIYMREAECTKFISGIPTVFDETVAVSGKVGAYAAIARRKGDTWYVGAINNWQPQGLDLDLGFLGEGSFKAEIFRDGINASRNATDYIKDSSVVSSASRIKMKLAPGGGWAASFTPVR